LPLAALSDGKKFVVEHYSMGLMPSFTATNTDYASVRNAHVLAAGIATPPPQAFNRLRYLQSPLNWILFGEPGRVRFSVKSRQLGAIFG
jgi:CHAT domain-containing protein